MVTRALSLSVEACLAASNLVMYGALLSQGARAGRIAHATLKIGAWAALAAAVLTLILRTDAMWLMDGWRADQAAQFVKAAIVAGLLVSVRISERNSKDWPESRVTGPLFRLACASGLIAATSAGDLLVSWIALDIASAAMILEVATAGRWSQRELAVRRMVSTWLPTSLLLLLAVILLAGMGGTTRYVNLEVTLPEYAASPAVIAGVVLAAGSILVRVLRLVMLFGSVRRT